MALSVISCAAACQRALAIGDDVCWQALIRSRSADNEDDTLVSSHPFPAGRPQLPLVSFSAVAVVVVVVLREFRIGFKNSHSPAVINA